MPTLLYVDITINAFFCVAKMKADHPTGKFYLTLLEMGRLEPWIRIAVGPDGNVDVRLRLGNLASGLTEVPVI